MELRHIYSLANSLNNTFGTENLIGGDINDIEVQVKVSPGTLYGIDQEFYRKTHNGSLNGFIHNKKIDAIIDNVRFVLVEKEMDSQ